ncbi:MAG: MarR family winged helix-turn-helix transcriptional regulator [Solirubrobacteraceae bacterium]
MLASKQVSIFQESPIPTIATELDTPTRLRAAVGKLSRRLRPTRAGAEAGLTPTRTSTLMTIVREGPIRISALAAAEGINPTMLSRGIAALVDAGLVERTCDSEDRRAGWVQPTAAGRRIAERMRRERTDAVRIALAELDSADRTVLEQALPALERLAALLSGRRP